ncbi:hypothetical protein B0T20DRAFT_409992 [Sordaria brevicollis]|uniref:Uncharacterized protein n=1 Tax=Sordaria brevicollis TaxID=83679 RepID=A0AAE0PG91_SORBR|nr:hypothetical protein B0T20DRAFT_409992 [Sordaria brevicollis]
MLAQGFVSLWGLSSLPSITASEPAVLAGLTRITSSDFLSPVSEITSSASRCLYQMKAPGITSRISGNDHAPD